jgi:[ribosomal protein S18]-alanine N-acetyltransferase
VRIRAARPEDGPAIAAIQRLSPEAPQWDPAGYDVRVAEIGGTVVGFLVTRAVAEDEVEVLNISVAPEHRRAGVAKALLKPLIESVRGELFLEVRVSNSAARKLYQALGFEEVNRRAKYYEDPCEDGIVMKFHSC